MKRRRFLRLAAATGATGATAAGAYAGAGWYAGSRTQSTALQVVAADYGDPGRGNGSQKYWDSLVRAFQAEHPGVAVEVTVHGWKDVDRKVAEMADAGRPPDIAQIGAYAGFAAQGMLYSAREVLSIPVQADFMPRLAAAGEVRRVQYGLPFVASTRLLFYNKTLFARAGLDPDAPPETWEELASAAAKLKSSGVPVPYGLPLGPEEAQGEALLWILGGGGAYTDRLGAYTIDAPANIRTFEWLRQELVRRKLTNRDPGRTDRRKLFDAFLRGDVGMLNGHPTLLPDVRRRGLKYGTAVVPGARGPSKSTLGVADWVMAFKQNGRREETGLFLDFLFSEKNHYAFADRYGLLPVTASGNDRMRSSPEHKPLRRFQDELESAEFYPVDKVSWGKVSADIKKNIGEAVAADGDPAAVLGGIQRRAQSHDSAVQVS